MKEISVEHGNNNSTSMYNNNNNRGRIDMGKKPIIKNGPIFAL